MTPEEQYAITLAYAAIWDGDWLLRLVKRDQMKRVIETHDWDINCIARKHAVVIAARREMESKIPWLKDINVSQWREENGINSL